MARKVKEDWLGGRTDPDQKERVEDYIDKADMTMGELVRKAVDEYMLNHPVEDK